MLKGDSILTTSAATEAFRVHDILRAIVGRLETPVVAILVILIFGAVALAGWLIGELVTERRHLKVKLPQLLDDIRAGEAPIADIIAGSGLLRRQKAVLLELTLHPGFSETMREALAVRLVEQEQARYDALLKPTELMVRLSPMFGLLGTLIPLGPGLIALGQGDTYTLSKSLLTAFDTTAAGLLAAAAATLITTIRRTWYRDYMSLLEALACSVLEMMKEKKGPEATQNRREDDQ